MRISHLSILAFSLVISSLALAQPARRVQLEFSGMTAASQSLIHDVMKSVMEVGDEQLNCAAPDAVTAEVLPEGFERMNAKPAPKGAGQPVYERWTIRFCGNEVPFLLTFWTMEQGGTAFDLHYPFVETISAADTDDSVARLQ